MNIGIDLRCLPTDGSPGAGIAHAARELAHTLIVMPARDVSWVLFIPHGAGWEGEVRPSVRIVELADQSGPSLRKAIRRAPCDILFVPSGAVTPGLGVPAIPWVHDVAIFGNAEWFPQNIFRRAITTNLFRHGVMHAQRILAVSQDTKDTLVRLFRLDPSLIDVTSEGGDTFLSTLQGSSLREAKQRAKRRLADRGVTNAFLLALGTVEPRKNLPMLISAWQELVPLLGRPLDLVLAGRDGWKLHHVAKAMRDAKFVQETGSRLHRISSITEEDRRDLLLAADVVTVPSWHEGFGLVALEAMQAETAVIASNAGALPEVVQDAGLLLPPGDVKSWVGALRGLLLDDLTRQHMAEQGKARCQGMTWERTAKTVLASLTQSRH